MHLNLKNLKTIYMKYFKTLTLLLFISFYSLYTNAQTENTYKIIYEADREGKKIAGNLEELINHVQNGNPIRVGWVLKFKDQQGGPAIEMQHWTDAGFITTLRGHVFAQISSIYQQGPSIGKPPGVFLVNAKANGWVAILGTTGVMRQKYMRDEAMVEMMKKTGMTEDEVNKQLKDMEKMKVHTKWAVQQMK